MRLATIVLLLAFQGCASPDNGAMEGQQEGRQSVPGAGADERNDGAEARRSSGGGPGDQATTGERPGISVSRTTTVTATPAFAPSMDPTRSDAPMAQSFVAQLHGTKDSRVTGSVSLRGTGRGVEVSADVQGVPAGVYTYAVTTYGDCSAPDRGSFGAPLDLAKLGGAPPTEAPATAPGAEPTPTAAAPADGLGPLEVAGGHARGSTTLSSVPSQRLGLLAARSIVIYAVPDAAKAGKSATTERQPVACGVIGIAGEAAPVTPTSIVPLDR